MAYDNNQIRDESDGLKALVFEEFPPDKTVPVDETPIVHLDEKKSPIASMNNHFQMEEKMYIDILSPQLGENEKLKRQQKKDLMNKIFSLLKIQFIFTYSLMTLSIIAIIFSHFLLIPDGTIALLIDLFKFYVTAIIGELIAILFFIVKNVFDKSIVDLISNFDKKKYNSEQED